MGCSPCAYPCAWSAEQARARPIAIKPPASLGMAICNSHNPSWAPPKAVTAEDVQRVMAAHNVDPLAGGLPIADVHPTKPVNRTAGKPPKRPPRNTSKRRPRGSPLLAAGQSSHVAHMRRMRQEDNNARGLVVDASRQLAGLKPERVARVVKVDHVGNVELAGNAAHVDNVDYFSSGVEPVSFGLRQPGGVLSRCFSWLSAKLAGYAQHFWGA